MGHVSIDGLGVKEASGLASEGDEGTRYEEAVMGGLLKPDGIIGLSREGGEDIKSHLGLSRSSVI